MTLSQARVDIPDVRDPWRKSALPASNFTPAGMTKYLGKVERCRSPQSVIRARKYTGKPQWVNRLSCIEILLLDKRRLTNRIWHMLQLGSYNLPSALAALTCSNTYQPISARISLIPAKAAYLEHFSPCSKGIHATILQTFVIQFNQLSPLEILEVIGVFVEPQAPQPTRDILQ